MTSAELGFLLVATSITIGILMVVSGNTARYHQPPEDRAHTGLTRLSIGILMICVPAVTGLGWLLAEVFGGIATA